MTNDMAASGLSLRLPSPARSARRRASSPKGRAATAQARRPHQPRHPGQPQQQESTRPHVRRGLPEPHPRRRRAGHYVGFETIGVIRGEEHLPLNPQLDYAVRHGMTLDYLDRTTYREKAGAAAEEGLRQRFGDFFLIPEGGSNPAAVRGAAEIAAEFPSDYDVVCCPSGTGGTLAGLAAGLPPGKRALGFAALKGAGFLVDDVARLQREYGTVTDNWSIELG